MTKKTKDKKQIKDSAIVLRISHKDKEELQKQADAKRLSLSSYVLTRIFE